MAQFADRPHGGSSTKTEALTYDPETKSWVPASTTTKTDTTNKNNNGGGGSGNTSSTSKTQTDSKKNAEKEYIEVEFNTLTGELNLVATEKTIRIKINDTIKIEGLGKYLSGVYFVTTIKRTISKDGGYAHTMTLLKNGFGNFKKPAKENKEDTNRKEKEDTNKTSTTEYKVGDKVKIVGDKATYSNASDGVKVPAWVKKKTLTIQQISKDKNRVLLKEIVSWTYVKFIQKV